MMRTRYVCHPGSRPAPHSSRHWSGVKMSGSADPACRCRCPHHRPYGHAPTIRGYAWRHQIAARSSHSGCSAGRRDAQELLPTGGGRSRAVCHQSISGHSQFGCAKSLQDHVVEHGLRLARDFITAQRKWRRHYRPVLADENHKSAGHVARVCAGDLEVSDFAVGNADQTEARARDVGFEDGDQRGPSTRQYVGPYVGRPAVRLCPAPPTA